MIYEFVRERMLPFEKKNLPCSKVSWIANEPMDDVYMDVVRVYAHMYLSACPLSSLPPWFGSQLHRVPSLTLQANGNYNAEQSFPRQTKSVFH